MSELPDLLSLAADARAPLVARLQAEGTDCWRLFHGVVEGRPGLTVDRYGPHLLAQTWDEAALDAAELDALRALAQDLDLPLVWNHRGDDDDGLVTDPAGLDAGVCHEGGVKLRVQARHRGQDPLLFLDLRAARRWVADHSAGKSVLNLFAYTCGVGVRAAAAGARRVWNVDFAASALAVGEDSARLNGIGVARVEEPETQGGGWPEAPFGTLHDNAIPVLRQLSGQAVKGRGRRRPHTPLAARTFDLVVLDPPRWASTPFGAVDVVRDYASLFKPALLSLAPGGQLVATNHVPGVALDDWVAALRRTAEKAGRPLETVEALAPDPDFPSPDGKPPLKVVIVSA